jgi:hypothetical protein
MPVWSILAVLVTGLVGCGGAPPSAPTGTPNPKPRVPARPIDDGPSVDPIAALAPSETVAYLVPGRVQLDLGGTAIDGPGGTKPIEVSLIGRQGNLVRAAVRLEHARFSVWTERARVLGVLARDFVMPAIYRPGDETRVVLRAGAIVQRLKRDGARTQIRFVGALEVEGWIPDELIVDERQLAKRIGRVSTPSRLFPGAVIRREPKWASEQLALVANAYSLTTIREIDPAWVVIAYADADVDVQGYVSRRDPPGRVHRPKDPDIAPQKIAPTAKVPSGTCLYTHVKGDPVGYIVGDEDVMLDDAGAGWWTLAIDTPWGPIPFAAQGPSRADLVGCAPAGSVPASTLNAQPPAPAP